MRHLITVEVDTGRTAGEEPVGTQVAADLDNEIRQFAETFGAGAEAQWDHPPYTKILRIEPSEQ